MVNKGDYVGGFVGRTDAGNASNIICNYLQDCYVEGNNYVGGLVGCVQTGNIYYNYSNTEIVALGENIGGVVGYIKMLIQQRYQITESKYIIIML